MKTKSIFAAAVALLLTAQTAIKRDEHGRVVITNTNAETPAPQPTATFAPIQITEPQPVAVDVRAVEASDKLPFALTDGDPTTPRITINALTRRITLFKSKDGKPFAVRTAPVTGETEGSFPYHAQGIVAVPFVESIRPAADQAGEAAEFAGADHAAERISDYSTTGKWKTSMPVFHGVKITSSDGLEATETISLTKYQYRVALQAGGDAAKVVFGFSSSVIADADGSLILDANGIKVRCAAPHVTQDGGAIDARWLASGGPSAGLQLEGYDPSRTSIIEFDVPRWGASASEASGPAFVPAGTIAVDGEGSVYTAAISGNKMAIEKYDAKGNPAYTAIFGGALPGSPIAISPDGKGNLFVVIGARSQSLPLMQRPKCGIDCPGVMFAKLDAKGEMTDSSFVAGPIPFVAGVDAQGIAYVAGADPDHFMPDHAADRGFDRVATAYAAKIDPASGYVYATYMAMTPFAVTHDSAGNLIVGGVVQPENAKKLPLKGRQTIFAGATSNGCILKIDPTKSGAESVAASTLIGGGSDAVTALAVDASNNIYATGYTGAEDFPTTDKAWKRTHSGGRDAFVCKFDPTLKTLRWSTFLGGSGMDNGFGMAVDANENVDVVGSTASEDFPIEGAPFAHTGEGEGETSHIFAARINSIGSHATWSLLIGTGSFSSMPTASALATRRDGDALLAVAPWLIDDAKVPGGEEATPRSGYVTVSNCVSCTAPPSILKVSSKDITGTGFAPLSKVLVNGAGAAAHYVSPTLIRLESRVSGDAEVTVLNPDQQSATAPVSRGGVSRTWFIIGGGVIVILIVAAGRRRPKKKTPQPISSGRVPVRRAPPPPK